MIAKVYSTSRPGFHAELITVEADIRQGMPSLTIVGLPDHAVRESRERIRSCITNAGFQYPAKEIIINLSPNDSPKEGGLIEAAMATAILVASGQVSPDILENTLVLGALSLDGSVIEAHGLTSAVIFAASQPEIQRIVIADSMEQKCIVAEGTKIFAIKNLGDLTLFASGDLDIYRAKKFEPAYEQPEILMESIFGLDTAKRALAIAAVGRHHCILVGSPGSGKTLLARAYRHILPPLSFEEAATITRIHSLISDDTTDLIRLRPFRSPHHTASSAAIVGGSSFARPGEITLAHHGTLFLDELPEFRSDVLQSLREPLEEKKIAVARARGIITYPADFQLIAAANPCRCGALFGSATGASCTCPKLTSLRQFSKLVGPFLDRISIELNLSKLPEVPVQRSSLTTSQIFQQVLEGRTRSLISNKGKLNADLTAAELYQIFSKFNPARLYDHYGPIMQLSMRSWLNALRVAKSIADFDGTDITEASLQEAMQYRFIQERMHYFHAQAA